MLPRELRSRRDDEKTLVQNGDGDPLGVDFYHSPFDTAIIALRSPPFRRSRLSLLSIVDTREELISEGHILTYYGDRFHLSSEFTKSDCLYIYYI